jgi:hypothetical protein
MIPAPGTSTSNNKATVNPSESEIEIVGPITNIETIAVHHQIRELARLNAAYGRGRWRKRKGIALVREPDGLVVLAEIHWNEAHGSGRKDMKVKRRLERHP